METRVRSTQERIVSIGRLATWTNFKQHDYSAIWVNICKFQFLQQQQKQKDEKNTTMAMTTKQLEQESNGTYQPAMAVEE